MRVIIAGSRSVTSYELVARAIKLSGFHISEVVSGCARGADQLGERWAERHHIPVKHFPADWARYGRPRAGHIRNEQMARYAEALVAVWDGESGGTKGMIAKAKRLGLRVFVLQLDEVVDEEVV